MITKDTIIGDVIKENENAVGIGAAYFDTWQWFNLSNT